jgi:BlaI family transcriptional regulator, penicillinase repressor
MGRKKRKTAPESLSRRERQIMDILLRRREAAASDVRGDLPDPPSYDAVRTILRILTEKGVAARRTERTRHLYSPAFDLDLARDDALTHLVRTFFQGSAGRAALALLRKSDLHLTEAELSRLEKQIGEAENAS